MAATIAVLYPDVADATFGMGDDLTRHMPMEAGGFGAHGMAGGRAVRLTATPTGGEGATVFGDVPNFSRAEAPVMVGAVVGHG